MERAPCSTGRGVAVVALVERLGVAGCSRTPLASVVTVGEIGPATTNAAVGLVAN